MLPLQRQQAPPCSFMRPNARTVFWYPIPTNPTGYIRFIIPTGQAKFQPYFLFAYSLQNTLYVFRIFNEQGTWTRDPRRTETGNLRLNPFHLFKEQGTFLAALRKIRR